uniref:U1-type domain-containing protein n=1 Tax=Pygocentrus nattereri TaxID=42514 RepID=A0AAR2J3S1_PYGNA
MDFQHRAGGKTGSGGVASASESNRDRRERLRQLALETIDINKDPYFMKNHLGSYECKLCLTLHNNEGSYLAHTQGKKHQTNFFDFSDFTGIMFSLTVTKQRDPETGQQSLLFQIDYPEIAEGIGPRHRFMSAYEQRIEPPDRRWQYLLLAAEPYETIAFKVPSREIDKSESRFWTHWNRETKQFFLQFHFKMEKLMQQPGGQPPPAGIKRPPPLMTGLGPRPPSEAVPPPPPGGIPGMPPLPPNAPPQMAHTPGMPPPGTLPPHLRPPIPAEGGMPPPNN